MYTLRHCVENIKFIYDASHRANKWVACASRMQISIDMSRAGGGTSEGGQKVDLEDHHKPKK